MDDEGVSVEDLINFKLIVVGNQGTGKSSILNRFVNETFEENKKDLTPEEYEESYLDIGKKYGGVFDNAYSEIKKLKEEGNRVYLLSNLHELAFKDFSSLFDTKIFDRLFLSFEIGMIKPNEDIFKYVIKEIDDEPKNMYFFDDKLENVNAAINTGMNAIVTTGSNLKNSIDSIKNRE